MNILNHWDPREVPGECSLSKPSPGKVLSGSALMRRCLGQWGALLSSVCFPRYEEQQHNCFTFALAFVNRVRQGRGREPLSKAQFTESFLLPHTREASRYLTLHQQLAHRDVYIVPLAEQEQDSVAANHSLLE